LILPATVIFDWLALSTSVLTCLQEDIMKGWLRGTLFTMVWIVTGCATQDEEAHNDDPTDCAGVEYCNGIDDDCDGSIPADETTDADGDGFMACGDCDDSDPFQNPAADEACDDGEDNDCDGATDSQDNECSAGDDQGDDHMPDTVAYWFALDVDADAATVQVTVTIEFLEDVVDLLCTQSMSFPGTLTTGTGQGENYWPAIDVVVAWSGPGEVLQDDCEWPPIDVFGIDWDQALTWEIAPHVPSNPMAFVSCDSIRADMTLSNAMAGPDPYELTTDEPQTLGQLCDDVGPALAEALSSGPLEGLWVLPMDEGWWPEGYETFDPAGGELVESWGFFGYLMNDPGNEDDEAFEGVFYTVSPWVFGI